MKIWVSSNEKVTDVLGIAAVTWVVFAMTAGCFWGINSIDSKPTPLPFKLFVVVPPAVASFVLLVCWARSLWRRSRHRETSSSMVKTIK
jgi:hypothetical protein